MGTEWTEVMNAWILPKGIWSIVDKRSHKVIVAGQIKSNKPVKDQLFISFDNIHYFNFHGTEKYQCTNILDDIIPLKEIPSDYYTIPWMQRWTVEFNWGDTLTDDLLIDPLIVDVYLEKDLDPEVIPLVTALNKIPGIETVTSCSGHNKVLLRIDFYCYTIDAVKTILKLIPDYMTIDISDIAQQDNTVQFKICSKGIGDVAYKQANEFVNLINQYLETIEDHK